MLTEVDVTAVGGIHGVAWDAVGLPQSIYGTLVLGRTSPLP